MPQPRFVALTENTYVGIETFPAPGRLAETTYRSSELTTRCPYTERSDFYQVEIVLAMDGDQPLALETKSLRLYLDQMNGALMSGERLADRICEDVYAATGQEVVVTLHQNIRGGIGMTHRAQASPETHPVVAHVAQAVPDGVGHPPTVTPPGSASDA